MEPRQIIQKSITQAIKKLNLTVTKFSLEHPTEKDYGDYSTNAALIAGNPKVNSKNILKELEKDQSLKKVIDRIETAGPGFINFYLKNEWLLKELEKIVKDKNYGKGKGRNKTVLVEYTDANPFKELHIGHLMSNSIGEAITGILEADGFKVKRLCYQGDIGMHVAKTIWAWLKSKKGVADLKKQKLAERVKILGEFYAKGASKFEKDKKEIIEINGKIYSGSDKKINEMYKAGRKWSLEYFETIYKVLGTKFDRYYFESKVGKTGIEIVNKFLAKGVFVKSDGAVIYPGEKYNLHNRVFINSEGLPTYEAKELGLAWSKDKDLKYDLSIVITGNEVKDYFKVVLHAMEKVMPKIQKKTRHIPHGMLKLASGKMSSRSGNIVSGEKLLESMVKKATKKATVKDVGEKVGVAAIKYSILKQNIGRDIVFNEEESLSFEGDTGPYLQYTYARAKSVLAKSKARGGFNKVEIDETELDLLRKLYIFPEVIEKASANYSPNILCTYLLELAQNFNSFYAHSKIVGSEKENFKINLTKAVSQIIQNGLNILGMKTVEKM